MFSVRSEREQQHGRFAEMETRKAPQCAQGEERETKRDKETKRGRQKGQSEGDKKDKARETKRESETGKPKVCSCLNVLHSVEIQFLILTESNHTILFLTYETK